MHSFVWTQSAQAGQALGLSLGQLWVPLHNLNHSLKQPMDNSTTFTQVHSFLRQLSNHFFTSSYTTLPLVAGDLSAVSTGPMMTTTFYKKKGRK